MVDEDYTNKQVMEASGADAVTRCKKQYLEELNAITPKEKYALTPEQQP